MYEQLELPGIDTSSMTRGGVKVLREEGYEVALYGLSKPYGRTPFGSFEQFCQSEEFLRMDRVAKRLAFMNNGENKFIRQVEVWLDILAPRNWWAHFDTYKVGTVTESGSIGYSINGKTQPLNLEDFEYGTEFGAVEIYNDILLRYQQKIPNYFTGIVPDKYDVKNNLPEGYLQNRVTKLNYAVLQYMYYSRGKTEKHPFWVVFFNELSNQLQFPNYVFPKDSPYYVDIDE